MAAIDDLNTAVEAVKTAQAEFWTEVTAKIDALKAAIAGSASANDPAIQAAAEQLNTLAGQIADDTKTVQAE